MTRREEHIIFLDRVPCRDDDTPVTWIVFDSFYSLRELIYTKVFWILVSCCKCVSMTSIKVSPLMTIYRTQIPPLYNKRIISRKFLYLGDKFLFFFFPCFRVFWKLFSEIIFFQDSSEMAIHPKYDISYLRDIWYLFHLLWAIWAQ